MFGGDHIRYGDDGGVIRGAEPFGHLNEHKRSTK